MPIKLHFQIESLHLGQSPVWRQSRGLTHEVLCTQVLPAGVKQLVNVTGGSSTIVMLHRSWQLLILFESFCAPLFDTQSCVVEDTSDQTLFEASLHSQWSQHYPHFHSNEVKLFIVYDNLSMICFVDLRLSARSAANWAAAFHIRHGPFN